jgi:hypothetical protein
VIDLYSKVLGARFAGNMKMFILIYVDPLLGAGVEWLDSNGQHPVGINIFLNAKHNRKFTVEM